jgi:hypothetical protein
VGDHVFPTAGSDEDLLADAIRERIEGIRQEARGCLREAKLILREPSPDRARAEMLARRALAGFASSLNHAEATEYEEESHVIMDRAATWVRMTFGCTLHREGTLYSQRCPVALGHNRIGLSIGGYAVRYCSLCGQDLSECPHRRGIAYLVPGGPTDLGWCRVCLEEACSHSDSEEYRVNVVGIIREVELEEISVVDRPGQPDARIQSIPISNDDLRETLGAAFRPGKEVSCDRCLTPCSGLVTGGERRMRRLFRS